jgi:integrase
LTRSTSQSGNRSSNSSFIQFTPHRVSRGAASIGKLRWHDLRHTFGSMKLEQGENIYYVQRQVGHSSIQVTVDIYGHLLETRKPQAAAKTDELVFGKGESRC